MTSAQVGGGTSHAFARSGEDGLGHWNGKQALQRQQKWNKNATCIK